MHNFNCIRYICCSVDNPTSCANLVTGGTSLLVSAETIYNEMVARRPDLVRCVHRLCG